MLRPMGLVCAGTLLLLVTGCTLDSFSLALTRGSVSREQTINGPLDRVAASVRNTLQEQQLAFNYSCEDDAIRLTSATKGQKFLLLLKRKKSKAGEQTLMRIEWEKNADEAFWLSLLEIVANLPQQPQSAQAGVPGAQPGLGLE